MHLTNPIWIALYRNCGSNDTSTYTASVQALWSQSYQTLLGTCISPGGGGEGGTQPKLGYNKYAQHKLKIWKKGGLKDLKRVFDTF